MDLDKSLEQGMHFGQWALQKQIGEGGNAVVWGVTNSAGRTAAIKLLKSRQLNNRPRPKRFRDEIEFLRSNIGRAGILPLIDANMPDVLSKEDRPWFTMPLAMPFAKLELSGAANLIELAHKIAAIASTLATLHEEHIWHRDLKPENLFLLNGNAVIGDFGLVTFPGKEAITVSKEFLGPLFYIAPEMMTDAADKPAGAADVYSLAKTFWVLASGHRYPLPGEQRLDVPALRVSTYCPLPRANVLDLLLERATSHDPSRRPAMGDLAGELIAWLRPAAEVPVNIDLKTLAKENESIFELENRAERNRKELIAAAEASLSSFTPVLSAVAAELSVIRKKKVDIEFGAYDLPKRFHHVKLAFSVDSVWRRANQVKITVKANHRFTVSLHSFAQVEALDNDTIRIVVGHLVQPSANGNLLIVWKPWTKEAIELRGTAQLENKSAALGTELRANLKSAVGEFVTRIRQYQSDANDIAPA